MTDKNANFIIYLKLSVRLQPIIFYRWLSYLFIFLFFYSLC